jgi:hypothetical protein
MMGRQWLNLVRCGCLLAAVSVAAVGCGGKNDRDVTPGYENLRLIGAAYLEATEKLKAPPGSLNDLKPFLAKHGDLATLLRSPEDGEDYVILWGVDLRV